MHPCTGVSLDAFTDTAVKCDVGMVDLCGEVHLGRLKRVVRWEMDAQEKHTTCEDRVVRSHDGSLPVEQILLFYRTSLNVFW